MVELNFTPEELKNVLKTEEDTSIIEMVEGIHNLNPTEALEVGLEIGTFIKNNNLGRFKVSSSKKGVLLTLNLEKPRMFALAA